jgi:hypothetical protein
MGEVGSEVVVLPLIFFAIIVSSGLVLITNIRDSMTLGLFFHSSLNFLVGWKG